MEISILVVFDANNRAVGIKNTKLPILLLEQLKKQQQQIEELLKKIKELENK